MIFASLKFFSFVARRNAASFAPACPRKLFVAHHLGRGSGETRIFIRVFATACPPWPGDLRSETLDFVPVRRGSADLVFQGAQNYWLWVLRTLAF
jgi:hypothetical protein